MGQFNGWPDDFQEFFIGLEIDNSKGFFQSHRQQYLTAVKAPLEALVSTLEPEFGPGRITRPNRDIRFSADKRPYKTNIYATVGSGHSGGYVALDAKGLTAAAGPYMLDSTQLTKFREAVASERSGVKLAAVVHELERSGYEVGGEELKRAPAGYPSDHPRVRLLRHKRLFFWKRFGLEAWLGSADAAEHVARVWRDAEPLYRWFATHVGPSTESAGRR